ncbi:hypothetical protein SDRG_14640 [Saprolegnia diclina VS20]|uniref:Transmembrane protein n=1 Tax=Saprolegnia diclina (strain VS20) TaxID=1156394 RepID=T0PZB7_SAPDV|nr:hypothetical protein SDRG_14640 [Saprolegnia diclina VS20]EQC27586.1 hypothetical protein SDRG_14640 [Saprolegnia diclina VS20]|eukprot:XP_008619006.1 hypothetical protein SDRG_14640 [Saprolegnia diclina VS20]
MTATCAEALNSALKSLEGFPGFSSCDFLSALMDNRVDLSLVASDCGSVVCGTFLATGFLSSRLSNCALSDGINTITVSTLRSICFYPSKQDALTHAPTTKPPKTTTPAPTTTPTPTTTSPTTPPVTTITTRSPIDNAGRGNQTTLTSDATSSGTTGMAVGLILIGLALLVLLCLFVIARKRAHRQRPQAPNPPLHAHEHGEDDEDDDELDWSEEVAHFLPVVGRVLQAVCAGVGLAALAGAFPTVTTADGVSTQLGGGVWTALLVVLVLLLLQGAVLIVVVYKDIASRPRQELDDDDDDDVHYVPLTTTTKVTLVVDVLLSLAGLVVGLSTAASDLNAGCGSVALLRCGPLRAAIAFDFLTVLTMWTLVGLWLARMDPDERRFHAGWPVSPSETSYRAPPEPYAAHAT